ncbi:MULTISPECIES: class I SAM-dependent methyltransferase [Streptomyces]|uniref:SAM-dependent methyltransferase n=4 Tax=Streptomyces TaxID=1883 RepID=A0A5P2BMZ2_STRVZ|nr:MULTISPECIES: class I SAM-dependent methyltransferase [Streptomyces]MYZ14671.1 methyltransferase domain-containing protein [Streptomyces sp. SID337]QES30481.1 SAM-dependent methyltransferase [Streptomyces venezuelae]
MLDYSQEADRYDASRGGEPRAAAAAEAVLGLLPAGTATLLDVACGTGLVTRRLAAHEGLRVTGVDAAYRMVRLASERVPGAIVLGDCRQLPFPDGSFDAVATVWLLHLLSGPDETSAVVAECARVLRPGGVYVTTVDKAASHDVRSDIDAVLAPRPVRPAVDRVEAVDAYAAEHGLAPAGRARFRGHGQGRSPRSTVDDLRRGWFTQIPPDGPLAARFAERLAALPDQDVARPDPHFGLRAYRKRERFLR